MPSEVRIGWREIERSQAMSGMNLRSFIASRARPRCRSRGRGRSPKRGAPRSTAHFAEKQREKPRCGTAASCSGATRCLPATASAPAISRPISQASWPGATGAFPTRRVQRLWHGRAALRRRRLRARRDGPHTVECRAHLFSVRHARSRRYQGRRGRHFRQRRARSRGGDRPCARRIRDEPRLALRLHRTRGGDDPDAAGRYAG